MQSIGKGCLYGNKALRRLSLPQVQSIGNNFLGRDMQNFSTTTKLKIIHRQLALNNLAKTIRGYTTFIDKRLKKGTKKIFSKDALRCALSQGITTEQVNQANEIEQEQTKENINEGKSIDNK